MNLQEYRNLQEAYLEVYDEGYKDLPRLRMARQTLKKLRRGFEGARTAIFYVLCLFLIEHTTYRRPVCPSFELQE